MRFPLLKALIVIDLILALLAVYLFLTTLHSNDFSGFIILVPICGMAIVGVLAFIIFVLHVFNSASEQPTVKSKLTKMGGLVILGLPVYCGGFSWLGDQPLFAKSYWVFMLALGIYMVVVHKLGRWRKLYEIVLVLYPPLLSVAFALTSTRLDPSIALVVGFGIFGIGLTKILRGKKLDTKKAILQ